VSPQFGERVLEMVSPSSPVVTSYRLPIVTVVGLTVFEVLFDLSRTDRWTDGQTELVIAEGGTMH